MKDPYERSIPKVDYKSLEWRLYNTMSSCYGWLDKNHPKQAELRNQINALIVEYETSQVKAHKERN